GGWENERSARDGLPGRGRPPDDERERGARLGGIAVHLELVPEIERGGTCPPDLVAARFQDPPDQLGRLLRTAHGDQSFRMLLHRLLRSGRIRESPSRLDELLAVTPGRVKRPRETRTVGIP